MMRKKTFYQLFGKRILDILLSGIALIVLSPIILIVGILVRIKLGSPIIFKQERPGKSEKIFSMYKFRTMTDERDHNGEYLPDEIRLTKFGKMLRATSLDELPELWNILKGDMSIVGPRPLLVEYLPLYSEKQRKRHNVKPGLTGLAQVNGRNAISWEEKFEYDYLYIEDYSFTKDISIIWHTIKKVLKHDGITSNSSVTNEKFEGNGQN
ncbi:sugar transferase [Enterococcus faecium]|uniref:sugar transferase n=1 Tax=Enterococcus faecium TaxID=1352 RepID=UPI000DFE9080|nr:sugar transferase [Enterococcus faecium]MDK4463597.1 sugar transferase [Enterococcus faecium]MDT2328709.1 sugar transferase [Enterococcus faecium]MDV7830974.1 sugar transferase [Enterococcus faecium]NTQ03027.1 sugar transferase [Enterococcus faecium]NTQ13934.1 sugar transferase [Enterococcus faecium]